MLNLLARLSFAVLVALPVYAQAETDEAPSAPDRNPLRAITPAVEVPEVKPVLPGDAPTVAWTDDEVAAAKLDCAKVLAGVTLEYEALPPLKEGICGAPAPILVKSIGGVAIDPAATMTCALASGLNTWISKTLQPQAKAILGTQVVKLHNATAYSCRNRYGGETTPLSEHALANALDISEFVFESGEKVTVLASWPRVVTVPPVPLPNPIRVAVNPSEPDTSSVTGISTTSVGRSIIKAIEAKPNELPRLPPVAAPPLPSRPPDGKSDFVKRVHDDACHTFGTVLGPEANEAHKDHLHLDMKARARSAFCE